MSRTMADSSSSSKSQFKAYNCLQAVTVAFGEKLPIPEIITLGSQSDGKSSLLEALLGFQFNRKTQALLEAFQGKKRVHFIDFSMNQGMQWSALMQALAFVGFL